MSTRCTAEQIAEAVIIWSIEYRGSRVVCMEMEDSIILKPLDLFLSTLDIFCDAFNELFSVAYDEHKQTFLLSKRNFVDYLKPRCVLLTEYKKCFDLLLTCAFISHSIRVLSGSNNCFHFSRVACRLLTTVLEDRFPKVFETKDDWEKLMSFCTNVHASVLPTKENRDNFWNEIPRERSEHFTDTSDSENTDSQVTESKGVIGEKLVDKTECKPSEHRCRSFQNDQEENESDEKAIEKEFGEHSDDEQKENESDEEPREDPNLSHSQIQSRSSNSTAEKESDSSLPDEKKCITECCGDETYWIYYTMSSLSLRQRVTCSEKHLQDVTRIVELCKEFLGTKYISSKINAVVASDDENTEVKETEEPRAPEAAGKVSENSEEPLELEASQEKNYELDLSPSPNCLDPDGITDVERKAHFDQFVIRKGDSQCKLCRGKKGGFKKKWVESFYTRFSNADIVSDLLKSI